MYHNKLILTYLQLCYFVTFHFTISTITNIMYIYLDGLKSDTHGSSQRFVITLDNPVKLN